MKLVAVNKLISDHLTILGGSYLNFYKNKETYYTSTDLIWFRNRHEIAYQRHISNAAFWKQLIVWFVTTRGTRVHDVIAPWIAWVGQQRNTLVATVMLEYNKAPDLQYHHEATHKYQA